MDSPTSKTISLKVLPSKVAVITFDNPGGKLNVLSGSVMVELDQAINSVAANPDVVGLVITSAKPGNFLAGADVEQIASLQGSKEKILEALRGGKGVFAKLEALGKRIVTVAAINGLCLGGGTEMALACTVRIASERADLGLPEVGLGFLPGWGGCVRLTKLVGAAQALPIITQPLKFTRARKAWYIGLVDEIVKSSEDLVKRAEAIALGGPAPRRAKQGTMDRAFRWFVDKTPVGRSQFKKKASAMIVKQTGGKYPALPAVLKAVTAALTQPAEKAFELESQLFAELATGEVSKSLVGLFFAQQDSKKTPKSAKPSIKPTAIGVAGAGTMGAGIAQVALYAGYPVVLYDKFPEGLKKGVEKIQSLFDYLVKKGKITREQEHSFLSNLAVTTEIAGLKQCDLVIEAIIEDMGKKKEFLAELEAAKNGKPFIFATNTSSLSVTEMSSAMAHPENAGGLHFFNPAEKMPLVEVVSGAKTSPGPVASLMQFISRLSGKYSVVTTDRPGFVVNRILVPYGYEAIKLLELGWPPEDIDAVMMDFGMKMGPLEVLDEVGLDVAGKVVHILNESLGARLAPPKLLAWIEGQKGLLGKKTGKGLFIWENGKKAGFNPDVMAALNGTATPATRNRGPITREQKEFIQKRLVMVMINEASRVLEEGIVESASQVDLAMVFGCGFPPYRGGILRYADTIGAARVVEILTLMSAQAGDNYKPSAYLLDMAAAGKKFYN